MNKSFRDKLAVALGNSLDWYDFALYGYFSAIIAKLYFPFGNNHESLILTFLTWFLGFLSRPLGSIIFGVIGDRYGRSICFKISSNIILIPVILFPFIPTYDDIGILATIILLLMRIIQGFCIGAEFAGGIIYLCESTTINKRYFLGSIGSCTGSTGILLASLVATICYQIFPEDFNTQYGWRIAFALAIIIALVSRKMRQNILDTEIANKIKSQGINNNIIPLFLAFKNNLKEIIISTCIIFCHATSFYMIFIYLPVFMVNFGDVTKIKSVLTNSLLLLLRICVVPFIGKLADKLGGIILLKNAMIIMTILSIPLFYGIVILNWWWCLVVLMLITTFNAGIVPGLLVNYLSSRTIYSTLSLVFNIAFGVFGGIVPVLCLFLYNLTEIKIIPAFYLAFSALVTLTSLIIISKEFKNGLSSDFRKE